MEGKAARTGKLRAGFLQERVGKIRAGAARVGTEGNGDLLF